MKGGTLDIVIVVVGLFFLMEMSQKSASASAQAAAQGKVALANSPAGLITATGGLISQIGNSGILCQLGSC